MPIPHPSSATPDKPTSTFRFPSLPRDVTREPDAPTPTEYDNDDKATNPTASTNGGPRESRWGARKTGSSIFPGSSPFYGARRARQKSLSEALRNIHNRRGSVSDNAHEIAEALKAPVSPKLILLCCFWFMTSIFSNASSKSILIAFRKPVTLTLVQFAFVSSWCLIASALAHRFPSLQNMVPALKHPIRSPTKELIRTTMPLTVFQIGGHILNSDAMARIPVSLVHTIKGLSPLFTVMAYRLFFRIHYSLPTYLSLIPLTAGVVMACSANFSGNLIGLLGAFGSALLFVTQNIVSKKLFNEAERAEKEGPQRLNPAQKPDKLNLLCYSSALAFTFTLPIWLWSELPGIIKDVVDDGSVELASRPDALDHGRLALEFIFNGTFHFAQSLVAFILLSLISPVTYSVASLIKRVFVITFAIVWFGNPVSSVQAFGIGLTFLGLYLYDRTHDASRAERLTKMQQARSERPLLPLIQEDKKVDLPPKVPTPLDTSEARAPPPMTNGAAFMVSPEDFRVTRTPLHRQSSGEGAGYLRPGTKQEETWKADDQNRPNGDAR